MVPVTLAGQLYNLLPAGGQTRKALPAPQNSQKASGMQGDLLNTGHSIYRTETNFVSLILQLQTYAAGFCLLSAIATHKNCNPCYWKRYTQERESEVVTQSVTPCWLNVAALVCFYLKHSRVFWFSIMTFYVDKWITSGKNAEQCSTKTIWLPASQKGHYCRTDMHMPIGGVPRHQYLLLVLPLIKLPWIWLTINSQVRCWQYYIWESIWISDKSNVSQCCPWRITSYVSLCKMQIFQW